ncbi:MAG: hypothetical protein JW748_11315 [Anaerolineales bacterium]|nr:hypothetical protein [Anaerolineales bacterium]
MEKKNGILKNGYLSPEVKDLLSIRNPDPIDSPRTPGAEIMLSILAVEAMMAVESVRRYGGITQRRYDLTGKPGRAHPEVPFLQ